MSPDDIIQKARDAAGLDQFENESFREGLDIATRLIGRHPLRTTPGKAFLEQSFVRLLANRLQLDDYVRRHPEIKEAEIARPIFILGVPRCGASLLAYLLSADPRYRSLLRWETAARTMARFERHLDEWGASCEKTHYRPPEHPTDCSFVLAQDFKSVSIEAALAHQDYSRWLQNTDMTPAYARHRLALQALQSKSPGTWALHHSSHALAIGGLLKTYPDARLIWIHRDPFKAVASFLVQTQAVQAASLCDTDLKHAGAIYPKHLREYVMRPMAIIDQGGADPFYHLYYTEFVRDPITATHKIYDWLGEQMPDGAEHTMRNWLFANQLDHISKQAYLLEDFGLSKAALTPFFEDYLRRFNIPPEQDAWTTAG